ncbi:MAG: N-acetylneuraminate synthase family protein, partial [Gammaproteobacteria bacterium]
GMVYPGLAAMARGTELLEVHVTFDRSMFGPDVPASVTFEELTTLCRARDAFALMDASPVDKNEMAGHLDNMRRIFGKSLAPSRDLQAGTVLATGMLVPKKPGGGISPDHLDDLIGRRLCRDVCHDHLLQWEDLDEQT